MTTEIEINCSDYELRGASIGHSVRGSFFRCTISPVSGHMLDKLNAIGRSKGFLRLVFPGQPLLLERITVERVEPVSIRVVGRIVKVAC